MLAMAALYFATDVVQGLERRLYDAVVSGASRQPLTEVVVVAIDEPSLAGIGPWPWPRDVHAQLIDRLAAAGAKTIVHTTLFDSPQTDRGLAYLRQIRSMLGAATPEAAALTGLIGRTLDEAEGALDTDGRLAASLQRAGNVFLASRQAPADGGAPVAAGTRLPPFVHRSALADPGEYALPAGPGMQPLALLGQAAAGVGHLQGLSDRDGVQRQVPLLLRADGAGLPALALLAAAHSLHLSMADVQPSGGSVLRLGGLQVPTDARAVLRPHHYATPATVLSFQDVLGGKVPPARLQNRIVLVGATAPSVQAPVRVSGGDELAPVLWLAQQVSSIRQGHGYTEPAWAPYATWLLLGAVALYLTFALPRLAPAVGGGITVVLACMLAALQWLWLQGMSQWLHLMLPALALVVGLVLHAARAARPVAQTTPDGDRGAHEADRMMGLALQGQGQLDMAYERLRRIPMGPEVLDNLLHLAQDFERKHQYDKARSVYDHILRHDREHKEARTRRKRARQLAEVAAQAGAAAVAEAPASTHPALLGRYEIEKELGRGAMGVVYQGRDPKIGRVVAIKALALGQEFDGSALVDARARFFREAESAGRLQHQNIVTIYDAGDESGLAWIAMELLKGQDLTGAAKPEHLLPVEQVVSIIARVADALDYAHQQNVVHRDIKPANIMFDATADAVKVSDFGIARITDSSKTRTGLVLGTPSFMAPEQLAGHKVDGRCDLYALGVTLFQLLTGTLPLRGTSMSELMHNIAHAPAPDVRQLRPELPAELARIVAQALRKNPQERYQTGRQFAADLRGVKYAPQGPVDETHSALALHYDARSVTNKQHKMADFQETVMDDTAERPPVSVTRPGAQ